MADDVDTGASTVERLAGRDLNQDGKVINLVICGNSRFYNYEWIEEHYIKLLKTAIIRELGSDAKLVYSIVMENTYGNTNPYTVKIPSYNRPPIYNPKVSVPVEIAATGVKNPFVIPGLKKVNIESQLNPNYNFENFIYHKGKISF